MMKQILTFLSIAFFSATVHSQSYWQQEVNYKINVSLDDKNHILRANEEFEYINNSPNSLDKIYVHLWPNAYRSGKSALGKQLYKNGELELQFAKDEDKGYIDSLDFTSNGSKLKWEYDPTNMDIAVIYLPSPLASGKRITIKTPFKVKLPSGEISRLGHIDQSYQITQWYPKPAVYDRKGWHAIPYLNQGEFYSEYGSFDVTITLPKNYVVGATGDLQTASEIEFLDQLAKKTDKNLTDLMTKKQGRGAKTEFPASDSELKTIRYTQNKVHDFAWFADKRYAVLKGEVELPHSKRKVTSWAMFVPHNTVYWQHAIEYINDGTYYYSLWNGDYPYNQVTAVDGTISAGGGMEYPNVTVIGNSSSKEELEVVIVHEVGHNWFYGILGSNERQHGWMDEGMNTLNEMRYMQTKYPNNTRFSDMVLQGKFHFDGLSHHDMGDISYRALAGFGMDQPIETHSADFTPANYGAIMYQKTGLVFFYLMDYLGEEKFNQACRDYFETWKFKHPYPEDMQRSYETSTGKKLDWLFNDLIQTTNHVDYKIAKVKRDKGANKTFVTVKNVGQVNGPIGINALKDNKLITSAWAEPGKKSTIELQGTDFTQISIDVNKNIPEINRTNNSWKSKGLFKKMEPIKFEFLIGDNESSKTNVFWTPVLAGNAYDKLMIGATFHNMGIPFKPFQYVVTPLFSFGRKNVSGMAELSYTFLPTKVFERSRFGVSIKSFGQKENSNSYLAAVAPYWNAELGNRRSGSPTSHNILVQAIVRRDVFRYTPGEDPIYPEENTQGGIFARYRYAVSLPDHNFSWNVRGDYFTGRQKFDQLGRISTQVTYRYRYMKQKMKRSIEVTAFAAANLRYETQGNLGNRNFLLSMSGARGYQDLFLEEYDFARNATSGFWSQQRSDAMGTFHSTSAFGTTSHWMTTASVYAQLPIKPGFLGYFTDFGAFYDGNSVQSAVNGGLGIRLGNILGVYFPLFRSANMGSLYNNYGKEIRFTLKYNFINKPLNLSNILN